MSNNQDAIDSPQRGPTKHGGSQSAMAYLAAGFSAGLLGFGVSYILLPDLGVGVGASPAPAIGQNAPTLPAGFRTPTESGAPGATIGQPADGQGSQGSLARFSTGSMARFVANSKGEPAPNIAMEDQHGAPLPMARWRNRVVLLNLWATWCAPCLRELPALDRLKAHSGGADFDVIALNIDKGSSERALKFLADAQIMSLAFIRDPSARAFAVIKTSAMPTTLLIGRDGRELGRLVGPAEWDSEEAKALIRAAIEQKP